MRFLPWVVLGVGAYMIWQSYQIKKVGSIDVPVKGEIPPGSQPTGRIQRTTNGNVPGDLTERLAYAVREFVEIMLPSGKKEWVEIDRTKV